MQKQIKIRVFFLWILSTYHLSAQISSNSDFSMYSTIQGLCDNTVSAIHQDSKGYIWVGTENGLSRFNGHVFTTFKHKQNDNHSIPHNRIFDICSDLEGKTWIATSYGLAVYNEYSNNFIRISAENGYSNLPNNYVRNVTCDSQGTIWFSNPSAICCISKQSKKIEIFEVPKIRGESSYAYIETMFLDRKNRIWIAIDEFLYMFDIQTKSFKKITAYLPTIQNQLITAIHDDAKGAIWIGTNKGTIFRYISDSNIIKQYSLASHNTHSSVISAIYKDKKGAMYVSIKKIGVAYYSYSTDKLQLIANPLFSFIDNCDVSCMLQDTQGNYWLGHTKLGLSFSPVYSNFRHIQANPMIHHNLRSNVVTAVFCDAQNNIWLGTDGAGLHLYNSNNSTIDYFPIQGLPANETILWIGSLEANTISICTYRSGVFVYNILQKNVKNISTTNSKLPTNDIRKVIIDKTNTLWYITHGKGISGISNNTYYNFNTTTPIPTQLSGDWTFDAVCLPDNSIAVASNYGLNIINPQRTHIEQYTRNTQDSITLSNNTIYCVWFDGKHTLWCGTLEGLSAFSLTTKSFTNTILSDCSIHAIHSTDNKYMWISSNMGLHLVNIETHTIIQSLCASDGIGGNQFSNGAMSYANKTMYAGGTHGITVWNPFLIQKNTMIPQIELCEVTINGNSLFAIDTIRARKLMRDSIITLSYEENTLGFSVSALQYIAPHTNKYSYRLIGYDTIWQTSNASNIILQDIPPGTYTLELFAQNNDGVKSKTIAYSIQIIPPWWKRWWAYMLYFLVIAIMLWAGYVYMYISVRNKHQMALEKAKNKHLEELYQAKINFFTNISHDIRTPLTLILSPIQRILKNTGLNAETKDLLLVMQRNANQLLQLVNELLDFKKIEAGALQLQLSETHIPSCVEQIVADFTNQAKQKNIELKYSCETPHVYAQVETRYFEKSVYNLLSNALKFTPEHGEIQVRIATTHLTKQRIRFQKPNEVQYITISVHDSGAGIPEHIIDKIFERFYEGNNASGTQSSGIGLSIVKAIIEQHGGFVTCKNNSGAEFIIHIPLHAEKQNFKNNEQHDTYIIEEEKYIEQKTQTVKLQSNSILIVEDNDELRNYLHSFLSKHVTVYTAANGNQGFEKAIEHAPDIIVSDIMMPDMNGYELCKKIKESLETSHIPIILLTAKDLHEHIIEGYTHGADDYIVKPCNEDILLLKIQNILQTRRQLQARFTVESKDLDEITSNSVDNKFIRDFMSYIHKHYTESELSVEDIGDTIGISRSNMYRKCLALTGKSPVDILQEVRIQNSIHLLKQTDLTISEIAYKVGYNDPRYFSNRFRKMTGVSPTEMREKKQL